MNEGLVGPNGSRAVVVGPLFLDIIMGPFPRLPEPGQELWCDECDFVAGGAANQVRALKRLGMRVDLCSYIGEDAAGTMVSALLGAEGIGGNLLQAVPRQSVTAALSTGTDRAMATFGSNASPQLSGDAPALLMGDLAALGANRQCVENWRGRGTLVIGDVGWDGSGRWKESDLAPLDLVDVFVPNEDEALAYTRTSDVDSAADALSTRVPVVAVTRGAKGVAVRGTESFSLSQFPADTVDPTGAGDVFSAFLAWALLREMSLRQAVSVAAYGAAISTESLGGSGTPTVSALRERLSRSRNIVPNGYDLSVFVV